MRPAQSIPLLLVCVFLAPTAGAGDAKPPAGKALRTVVAQYLQGDFQTRVKMREEADATYAPLRASALRKLRKDLLKYARKTGPKIEGSGTNHFYGRPHGKYIVSGKPSKTLFVGLHGGGVGSGDAGSVPMGGGGWWWIYPEVLDKTERGWTSPPRDDLPGTERFVMDLIDAAKRTGKVDPNRIYLTGHSMGGFGTWHLGAHHADVFAGLGAFAGAPIPIWDNPQDKNVIAVQPGVLPNLFNIRLHVYQSLDDQNVPPKENQGAIRDLKQLEAQFPDGFDFRYHEVDGRGHAGPPGGYPPDLKWLYERQRQPRPKAFLWQPVLTWKRQFYWVYWDRPEEAALIEVRAEDGNVCDITVHEGMDDLTGLSVLIGEPLFDLEKEIVVRVNGEERFRGGVERTFSTLLMTLPRFDPDLLFDARVDL